LKLSVAVADLQSAWIQRSSETVGETASRIAAMATRAYEMAEPLQDEIEILIGVLIVEAAELSNVAAHLANVPANDWDDDSAAEHFKNVVDYKQRIEDRLGRILGPSE
jgi:hypothetical protein